jgi:hypothetical protein
MHGPCRGSTKITTGRSAMNQTTTQIFTYLRVVVVIFSQCYNLVWSWDNVKGKRSIM